MRNISHCEINTPKFQFVFDISNFLIREPFTPTQRRYQKIREKNQQKHYWLKKMTSSRPIQPIMYIIVNVTKIAYVCFEWLQLIMVVLPKRLLNNIFNGKWINWRCLRIHVISCVHLCSNNRVLMFFQLGYRCFIYLLYIYVPFLAFIYFVQCFWYIIFVWSM